MKEKSIEQYLIDRVKDLGGRVVKFTSPGDAGNPDRLIKLPNAPAFLVELKRPSCKPTELQYDRIGKWLDVGMFATWADSRERVDQAIKLGLLRR